MWGLVAALAVLVAPQEPQQPPSSDPAVTVRGLVVEGRSPADIARGFIAEVASPPRGATVARWNERVCVGTVGLGAEPGQFLIDRVARVALDLGVTPEEPGCDPTVLIIGTTDGRRIAHELVEARGRVLAPGNSVQSRSRRDLQAFVELDRPVRWWHISTAADPVSGKSVVRSPADDNFNSNDRSELLENLARPVWGASSLLQSTVRQHLRRAIIIIDFDELGEVNFDQLADYVAFVALAQVDPEADTSAFPTILNLFADPTTPGLTAWDRAYLQGLYGSDDSARGGPARDAALRREMLRALQREDAATAGE